jgi:hypothetical protein
MSVQERANFAVNEDHTFHKNLYWIFILKSLLLLVSRDSHFSDDGLDGSTHPTGIDEDIMAPGAATNLSQECL